MKILVLRQVDIQKSFWIISEVELVRSLNKHGHEALLMGIGDKKQSKGFIKLLNSPFGKAKLFRLKMFFYLPYFVIKNKIDVVIIDPVSSYCSILLGLVNKVLLKTILLDIRTIPVEADAAQDKKYINYGRVLKKIVTGGIFITEGIREYVENKYNLKLDKYIIRPSGINTKIFDPDSANPLPSAYTQATRNKFIIFYHGSISPNRGINNVLNSIASVKNEISNIMLVSISNNNNYIREYCRENNLDIENNLLLLEPVDNIYLPGYINSADCCVVPLPRIKWWEVSSPLKLFEYLAMGKLVILTNIKAHLNVVPANAMYAYYYDPDKPCDLTLRMISAYLNSAAKQYFSEERKMVSDKYEWDVQAKELIDFIESIQTYSNNLVLSKRLIQEDGK